MEKSDLKYPAIYKHFKDKYYATMGISEPIECRTLINICRLREVDAVALIKMTVNHTERFEEIKIFEMDETWYHLKEDCKEKLVLYKSLYDNHGAYARDIYMFSSEVDKEKYPDVTQKYRFELFNY